MRSIQYEIEFTNWMRDQLKQSVRYKNNEAAAKEGNTEQIIID